jgi:hypothetical protein
MRDYKKHLRTEYLSYAFEQVLKAPVSALIGVTTEAEGALGSLSIHSVFDLAVSKIFNNARAIAEPNEAGKVFLKYNLVPSDVIRSRQTYSDVAQLAEMSIEVLDGIGEKNAPKISASLAVSTVRELAAWPPFLAAKEIIDEALSSSQPFSDDEIPGELVPKFNEFPTEKVFYSVYTIDDLPIDPNLSKLEAPLDITRPSGNRQNRIRKGYILRYEQAWNPVGLALGNLLHSLALAPGESTRVAVVDWTRKQGVRTDETISQLESLSNSLMHTRSINEVTRAVAREAQSGFSNMHSNSTVSNTAYSTYGLKNPAEALKAAALGAAAGGLGGAAAGGVAGAAIGGVAGAVASFEIGSVPGWAVGAIAGGVIGAGAGGILGATGGGIGAGLAMAEFGATAGSTSDTSVDVVSTTSSSGQRELFASMAQNIMDRTQQLSNASRNKRASIVQEVTQQESEKISTRVVTNYNHMHALTIQYFEVIQMYKVKVRVAEATRCLYVPFKPIAWNGSLAEKYRSVLARNALNYDVLFSLCVPRGATAVSNLSANVFTREDILKSQADQHWMLPGQRENPKFQSGNVFSELRLPSALCIDNIASLHDYEVVFTTGERKTVRSGTTKLGLRISSVRTISISIPRALANKIIEGGHYISYVCVHFEMNGQAWGSVMIPFSLRKRRRIDETTDIVDFLAFQSAIDDDALLSHLNANTNYYTTKVVQSFNEFDYADMLCGYKYEDKPLLNQIDLKPLALSGNYIIFKLNASEADEKRHEAWKAAQGYYMEKCELIPLGTGGVFAEAVQGRANAAEKLDVTRFWNWQDSPIPIVPPEIAPLQAGSRATSSDVRPGGLEQPVIQIVSPPGVPDPTSLPAMITALTAANMFRDMSGMAQTAQLAQAALENAATDAVATGSQASSNLEKGMAMTKELLGKILTMSSDFATLLANTGFSKLTGSSGLAGKSISNAGAAINHGKKIDGATGGAAAQGEGSNAARDEDDGEDGDDPESPEIIPAIAPAGHGYEAQAFGSLLGERSPALVLAKATKNRASTRAPIGLKPEESRSVMSSGST